MRRQMKDVGLANDGIIYDTFSDTSNLTHDTRRMLQSLLQGSIASTSRAAIASGSVVSRPYYSGTQNATHKPASPRKRNYTRTNQPLSKKKSSILFCKDPPISYLASAIRAANLRPRTYALQDKEKLRKRRRKHMLHSRNLKLVPFSWIRQIARRDAAGVASVMIRDRHLGPRAEMRRDTVLIH